VTSVHSPRPPSIGPEEAGEGQVTPAVTPTVTPTDQDSSVLLNIPRTESMDGNRGFLKVQSGVSSTWGWRDPILVLRPELSSRGGKDMATAPGWGGADMGVQGCVVGRNETPGLGGPKCQVEGFRLCPGGRSRGKCQVKAGDMDRWTTRAVESLGAYKEVQAVCSFK
jgi:hypothetical protein